MKRKIVSLVSVLVLLTACGGGGGGGGGGPTVTQFPGVKLTAVNAEAAGATVIESSSVAEGSSGGSLFLTGVSVSGGGGSDFSYAEFVLDQLQRAGAYAASSSLPGVTQSGTDDCDNVGVGTVDYTVTVADPAALSPGDSFSLVFHDCELAGEAFDGGFAMTIDVINPAAFTGFPPYDLTVTTTMTGFMFSDGVTSFVSNGDMTIAISADGAGNVTVGLSGNGLSGNDGTTQVVLTNYNYQTSVLANGDYTVTASGTTGSSLLGGSVNFTTTVPLAGNEFVNNGNPTSGTILMESNIDSSSAMLTVESGGSVVRIQIDDNGDGTYDNGGAFDPPDILTTWAALEAL